METEVKEITKCRVCGSENFSSLFSLGNLYLSTFVDKKGENIGRAPIDLVWCNNCTLVQLKHTAPQELLYSRRYWYKSGINKMIIDDLKEIAEKAMNMVSIQDTDVVLDIGANDGTLLRFYPADVVKIGCEPATNLVAELKSHADIVIDDFWDYEKHKNIFANKKAKIITAIGMFYDMDDPGQFIRDAVKALDSKGVFITQLMTSKPMLEKNDVGNICHEHLEYYSYSSLRYLFEKNGLEIFKVEENAINGGSYRLFARHYTKGSMDYAEDLTKEDYLAFAKRIEKNKQDCVQAIQNILQQGKKVYVYGASTKGNTILQYYGLNGTMIKGAAEIHPEKIGKFTVATNIPIVREEEAKKDADYFLVLPFSFREGFIQREQEWLKGGGKFIFCTPEFEIYTYDQANKIPSNIYDQILEHTVIAAVDAVISHEGKVFLSQRTQEPCKGQWWIPGGRQHKGETGEEAVLRKVKEELGIEGEVKKLVGVYDVLFDKTASQNVTSGVHYLARVFLVHLKQRQEKQGIEAINNIKLDQTQANWKWIDKIEEDLHPYVQTALQQAAVFEKK